MTLSELVFSTVLKEIKNAFAESVSDMDLIQLMYDAIIDPTGIQNKKGESIFVTKSEASAIMNRKKGGNPLKVIRQHSDDKNVRNTIEGYFQKNIVPRLLSDSIDDLIGNLIFIIKNDSQISDAVREKFLSMAKKETLATFLANVYLYSLTRKNVIQQAAEDVSTKKKIPDKDLEEYKKRPLAEIQFTDKVQRNEKRYANALLQMYGQLQGVTQFTLQQLESIPEYKKEFRNQRSYYYAAEAVRRGTRDIYNDSEDQFSYLKDEIYEGVKEVWEDQYKNGQARMRKVMIQACNTNVDGCWLTKDTAWVGNSQRKGICHFLVNESRLEGWVRDDDGEVI